MAYSREDPYRSLGLYLWDPILPKRFDQTETPSRRRPSWTDDSPVVPSPNPDNPFGDPPRFHDVNPPEQNPYSDPAYIPNGLVTENLSERARGDVAGGLLGLLREAMRRVELRSEADLDPIPRGVQPKTAQIRSASSPPLRRLVRTTERNDSI